MEDAGRYVVFGEIASGGMAKVHVGRLVRPAGFSRTVAVKRLHNMLARDPEFVAMFLDEARLAARVVHPNVVPMLDIVAIDDELLLIMEYVAGESLGRLIRGSMTLGEPIPPAIAANVVANALHGLHAAHEAKDSRGQPLEIVHRDVSPQNILVGVDGVARVLDFGVAKAVGRAQSTKEGSLKGKLGYMAPEQFEGRATRQTDVYAAAVVLWEALTRKRLFGSDDQAKNVADILTGELTRPSEIAPGITPALEAVVMKGLARRETERFATAREMALALEEAEQTLPASAIGAWVERIATMAIAERATMVREIENMVTGVENHAAILPSKSGSPGPGTSAGAEAVGGQTVTLIVPASFAPASLSRPSVAEGVGPASEPRPAPPARRAGARLPIAIVLTIAAAAAAVTGGLWWRSAASRAAPTTTAIAAVAAVPSPSTAPPPSAEAPAIAPPSSAPVGEVAPAARAAAGSSARPAAAAAPRSRGRNCNPPYTQVVVDGHLRQIPKRECL